MEGEGQEGVGAHMGGVGPQGVLAPMVALAHMGGVGPGSLADLGVGAQIDMRLPITSTYLRYWMEVCCGAV